MDFLNKISNEAEVKNAIDNGVLYNIVPRFIKCGKFVPKSQWALINEEKKHKRPICSACAEDWDVSWHHQW